MFIVNNTEVTDVVVGTSNVNGVKIRNQDGTESYVWGREFNLAISTTAGISVTATRIASPIAGASIGVITDGAKIYYKDEIQFTCSLSSGYTFNSWTVNGSSFSTNTVLTRIVSSNITVNASATLYVPSLETYTWAQIKEISEQISSQNMTEAQVESEIGWKVGDTKGWYRILGFNHDVDTSGNKIGITFGYIGAKSGYYFDDGTFMTASPWQNCILREETMSTIESGLASDIRAVIRQDVSKTTGSSFSNEALTTTTTESLFIPSAIEVGGSAFSSASGAFASEGSQYSYFAKKGFADLLYCWTRSIAQSGNAGMRKIVCITSAGTSYEAVSPKTSKSISYMFCV